MALEARLVESDTQLRAERVKSRRTVALGVGSSASCGADVVTSPAPSASDSMADYDIPYHALEVEDKQVAGGGFGVVYKALWQGCLVAVKRLFDPTINDTLRAEFRNEVELLGRLHHPNVVALLAVVSRAPYLCIVMEFMARGSLYHVLHNSPALEWTVLLLVALSRVACLQSVSFDTLLPWCDRSCGNSIV